MTNFTIREIQSSDLASVANLFDLYRQFYEQQTDIDLSYTFLKERIERGESIILVAVDPSEMFLGFCQLYPSFCSVIAKPIYVLYDLFVLPDSRQQGVGKHLLNAAAELAGNVGIARMDLTTAKNNLVAQALYESLGWKQDDIFYTYNLNISKS